VFKVSGIERGQVKGIEAIVIDLQREGNVYICSGCGKEVKSKHSSRVQEVRHLHLWKYLTILRIQKVKVRCPGCGVKVEKLDFLDRNSRQTVELTHQVSEFCKVMSIEDVATFEQLHWQTVKE
jgi:transposase